MSDTNSKRGDFAETTAFERYGVKTNEKPICIISTGLPVQRTVDELSYNWAGDMYLNPALH